MIILNFPYFFVDLSKFVMSTGSFQELLTIFTFETSQFSLTSLKKSFSN